MNSSFPAQSTGVRGFTATDAIQCGFCWKFMCMSTVIQSHKETGKQAHVIFLTILVHHYLYLSPLPGSCDQVYWGRVCEYDPFPAAYLSM